MRTRVAHLLFAFVLAAHLWVQAAGGDDASTEESEASTLSVDDEGAQGEEEEEEEKEYEHHNYVVLEFFFNAVLLGTATEFCLEKYHLEAVPYTVVLFLEGLLLEGTGIGAIKAMRLWLKINPHVFIYSFLPLLLFGDAMNLNIHVFMQKFNQVLVLAVPGVFIGTGVTACAARYILPYGWSWELCGTFGSICAATDPVAVVALLEQLGASAGLTMVITGESLLNDGTAMVLFSLFFEQYLATISPAAQMEGADMPEPDVTAAFVFACRLALGGPLLGFFFGSFALALIWMFSIRGGTGWQITVTIATAYLSFYMGEHIFGVSGVLCTVTAAAMIAAYGWPLIPEAGKMHEVWHTLEFIANIVVFVLAGALFADTAMGEGAAQCIDRNDFGYLVTTNAILINRK